MSLRVEINAELDGMTVTVAVDGDVALAVGSEVEAARTALGRASAAVEAALTHRTPRATVVVTP